MKSQNLNLLLKNPRNLLMKKVKKKNLQLKKRKKRENLNSMSMITNGLILMDFLRPFLNGTTN